MRLEDCSQGKNDAFLSPQIGEKTAVCRSTKVAIAAAAASSRRTQVFSRKAAVAEH